MPAVTIRNPLEKLFGNTDLQKTAFSSELEFEQNSVTGDIQLVDYNDQTITLNINVDKNAPLITSHVYYPGWNIYIDGKKTKAGKVNYMFLGTIVPEGNHIIEFKFQPQSFYNGLYISVIGVFTSILIAGFLWRKKSQ